MRRQAQNHQSLLFTRSITSKEDAKRAVGKNQLTKNIKKLQLFSSSEEKYESRVTLLHEKTSFDYLAANMVSQLAMGR